MRSFKMFGALLAIVALGVVGVANASAATFTASATGNITGKALATQEFTTDAGTVKCTTIDVSGEIKKTADTEQTATIDYTNCTAFGIFSVHNIHAHYTFTANGEVHIVGTITITVTTGFGTSCSVKVKSQTVKSADYVTSGSGVKVTPTIAGINYEGSGGLCGSGAKTNGTYTGASEVTRAGGGTVSFDP